MAPAWRKSASGLAPHFKANCVRDQSDASAVEALFKFMRAWFLSGAKWWTNVWPHGRKFASSCAQVRTRKVGSVAFFSLCVVFDEILQELKDTIQVTMMDCDTHPEGQRRCRVGYLARRIAHNKAEAAHYFNHTAVVIELLKD